MSVFSKDRVITIIFVQGTIYCKDISEIAMNLEQMINETILLVSLGLSHTPNKIWSKANVRGKLENFPSGDFPLWPALK